MSDTNMTHRGGLLIGTAGHVDHGKTSLIRALTGVDTDRLVEEKKRGISIDLGFAHLNLPGGLVVSFIDVPGHERFIKNMLAGVGGIQAVLLVVAADESVKPQTEEHLDICRLLGIRRGLVVLSKSDLVSAEQLERTRQDTAALCAGTFLESAPMIPVSATTREGLVDLERELSSLATAVLPPSPSGLARLPVDRSFSLKGFGTVVTGTLWQGVLEVGEAVLIHPGSREARIRGLQVHGDSVPKSVAGQRTAVNLAGIESHHITRGATLTHKGGLTPVRRLDVSVEWLPSFTPNTRATECLLHIGTSEIVAQLKMLDEHYGRLTLAESLLALPGDRFVLRRPSPAQTVAGGSVIDAFPPLRLNRKARIVRLQQLATESAGGRLRLLVEESAKGRDLAELVRLTGLPPSEVQAIVASRADLVSTGTPPHIVSKAWIERHRQRLLEWLRRFHAANPSAAGASMAQARLGLNPTLAAIVFDKFPQIRMEGDLVALATHSKAISASDTQALARIERAFREGGFQPPPASEVLQAIDPKSGRRWLEALVKDQKLIRLSEEMIFHADVLTHIRHSLAAHKGRRFSVPEFKTWTNISRKHAIPLLEYLDRQHVTRREGDLRVVL